MTILDFQNLASSTKQTEATPRLFLETIPGSETTRSLAPPTKVIVLSSRHHLTSLPVPSLLDSKPLCSFWELVSICSAQV